MERPPESTVIAKCQVGDEDGFRQFMDLFRGYIFTLCYSVSHDREESLDLCQEVFLNAFRAIGSLRQGAPVKPWLRRIAVNTSLNYRRSPRSGIHMQLTADGTLDGLQDRTSGAGDPGGLDGDPAEQVESLEAGEAVRRAIKSLPQDQRLAVVLFHQEGMSYDEISAETGWPLGTVKTNLFRGRKELGRLMKAFTEGGLVS